jgi:hypothetical protein
MTGCGDSADHRHSDIGHLDISDDHAGHDHAPPMGGHLIELGDHEFQVELVLYPETGALEAYVWDGHAERDVPIAMKTLTVNVSVGETSTAIVLNGEANLYGKSADAEWSKYKGQHDSLKKTDHLEGTLGEITIAGKKFASTAFHYHLGEAPGEHDHEH